MSSRIPQPARESIWSLLGALIGGVLLVLPTVSAAPPMREAPNLSATPANQLAISGNACGPAAMLNALRFGDANWQKAAAAVAGASDRDRLLTIIRTWGLRPSRTLPSRKRWSRHGVNVDDLCDIGNEMTQGQLRQLMKTEVLLARQGETPPKLLARVHERLSGSLKRGLPPIISVRRIAKPNNASQSGSWEVLQGHYVTVIALPTVLDNSAAGFPITYIDPWGGKRCTGHLRISTQAFVAGVAASPCLEADFPQADVGKALAKKGTSSVLTLAAAIGKW